MANDPRLNVVLNEGIGDASLAGALGELGLPVTEDMAEQLSFFVEAMKIYEKRGRKYGDAWKKYGANDCLFHMRSKLARIQAVIERGNDGDLDDGIDLLNYTVFAMRNSLDGNLTGRA